MNQSYYPNYPNYFYPQMAQPNMVNNMNANMNTNPTVQRKVDLVQGRAMADVYPVDAGTEVVLVDMDNPVVYRKARGFDNVMQPMEVFDLTPHKEKEAKEPKIDLSAYVKADEIDGIIEERIKEEVDKRLSEISFAPKKTTTKKGE